MSSRLLINFDIELDAVHTDGTPLTDAELAAMVEVKERIIAYTIAQLREHTDGGLGPITHDLKQQRLNAQGEMVTVQDEHWQEVNREQKH